MKIRMNRQRLVRIGTRTIALTSITITFLVIVWRLYLPIAAEAHTEEKIFWRIVSRMTLQERSMLLNQVMETQQLPNILPWWEYDEDLCSATVIKYINLFTGVKFVHAPAWKIRTHRINSKTISNMRKLTTVWDHTENFDSQGHLSPKKKTELIQEVTRFPFDSQKVYIFGLLWEETVYWEKIRTEGPDVNSHLVFFAKGKAIHFMHKKDENPLRMETLEALFADGKLLPVWIAEVHFKNGKKLRLPEVRERTISFVQNNMPWETMQKYLIFPRHASRLPFFINRPIDAVLEKSLLFHFRNDYDLYPQIVRKETQ
ncbi:MAG: hypothetical protein UU48_C0001G0067 [Candidatus Uhrbacteria bacterium GW2011_GWF2_41_16]|uniref:Uncharacterized protein n=2 Tax=Candidatus Uhriibacteriota TaxID=1752732 RepID=A0A0G0YEG6_9BACT|nr:MAG: hypothetical protein UU31_C0002G0121 [Candidatus Uhrbacteria bacterium GW2011_GWA2_41_10]KKR87773.1 MAG: hypothetical protein UU35_C0001G0054 [Candidatus Uhrbacteria bacterium GW2011_GWC2_41_11]KKR98712.1 MAG: hypothetical protein UU48_C0001G0067 [Candidatus Uhrbacteria bacterium GW2011_GWF2_41_16]HBP00191.1 hypothetical protein [Candidatus Uhrbacteria bacterium]